MKICYIASLLPVLCQGFVTQTSVSSCKPAVELGSARESIQTWSLPFLPAALLSAALTFAAPVALAVSGGGLDYAGTDITGADFSKGTGDYKGKDFTQVIAKTTNFAGSNFQGCRFFKAYLARANFEAADVRGVSFEYTNMDEVNFKDTIAAGAYFDASILDVKDLTNADFTDAQILPRVLPLLCEREDVKGTNPVTGADTRESLMCP